MSASIFLGVGLLGATAAWVLAPMFRAGAAEAERSALETSERAELLSRKEQVLAALRDLEDDRDTGKLSLRDYEELHARLTGEAAAVLRRLDEIAAGPTDRPTPPRSDVASGG